jgi:hypothetical protein
MWSIDSSGLGHGPPICMSQIKALLDQISQRINVVGAAAVASATAALLAYFRSEAAAGIRWLLAPAVRHLPWHRNIRLSNEPGPQNLTSELTLVDVYLVTTDGTLARYEKATNFVVTTGSLSMYREAVTASGRAHGFSTELGIVLWTTIEHGFHVSQIDLGANFPAGTRFRNIYGAELADCFTHQDEHWTQEIAIPTKHLTLRIHFPAGRPPKLVRCKRVVGLTETQISTEAIGTELFGERALVWEIDQPALGNIYKLEWRW